MRRPRNPRARDLATLVVQCLPHGARCGAARERLDREGWSWAAVVRGGRPVGGVTRALLDRAARLGFGALRVADLMAEEPPRVPPDAGQEILRRVLASPDRPFAIVEGRAAAEARVVPRDGLPAAWLRRPPRVVASDAPARLEGTALGLLRAVGREAARCGRGARLVGGAVRDLVLGRPVVDLDLSVDGAAADLAEALARALGGTARAHDAFGTASVRWDEGSVRRIDLAGARGESYARPGALPEVRPGGVVEDLLRRDFACNSVAIDLAPRRFGEWIDPCQGIEDILGRTLRVLHGLSFLEDPTRIFRAARFEARLGFAPSRPTARLARLALGLGVTDRVSAARLRREIVALFPAGGAAAACRVMRRRGLWNAIARGAAPGPAAVRRLGRLDSVLAAAGPEAPGPAWAIALTLALLDEPPRLRRWCAARLAPERAALRLLENGPREAIRLATGFEGGRVPSPGEVWGACSRRTPAVVALAAAIVPRRRARDAFIEYLRGRREMRPEITGNDLLEAGVPPGPAIAAGLRAALRARLAGRAPDRQTQIAAALRAARARRRPPDGRA